MHQGCPGSNFPFLPPPVLQSRRVSMRKLGKVKMPTPSGLAYTSFIARRDSHDNHEHLGTSIVDIHGSPQGVRLQVPPTGLD